MNHVPAMARVPLPPLGKSALANQALLLGPADEQGHTYPRKQSQDMNRPFVVNAQTVFETRAIQPLVQAAFDSPVVPVQVEPRLGGELPDVSTGDQILHCEVGLLTQLAVQAAQLRCPGQAQLGRLNGSGGQGAPFPAAAIVLQLDYLRGKRSPAGVVGPFSKVSPGYR